MSHFIHRYKCLAIVLLLEASSSVLVLAKMRRGISLAQYAVVYALKTFKQVYRVSLMVLMNLRPVLFLGSVKWIVFQ